MIPTWAYNRCIFHRKCIFPDLQSSCFVFKLLFVVYGWINRYGEQHGGRNFYPDKNGHFELFRDEKARDVDGYIRGETGYITHVFPSFCFVSFRFCSIGFESAPSFLPVILSVRSSSSLGRRAFASC